MSGGPINVGSLEALQGVLQRFIKAHQGNDIETQRDILQRLVEREQTAYQRKLKLLAELKTVIQETRAAQGTEERVTRLIAAFRFSCDLRAIGYEQLDDKETGDTAQDATSDLYHQLKAIIPEGPTALIDLLDDPSPNVRSSAAALLLDTIPDRATQVIEELQQTACGTDASISARFALRMYRAEAKPRS
jgi:hypothetical protein